MLGAELAYDPKIKVVYLLKYYNFSLVNTSIQSLYDTIQTRSNILLSNDDLHLNYDLETKLALVMNTKVVHNDILNMVKVSYGHTIISYIGYLNYFLGQLALITQDLN